MTDYQKLLEETKMSFVNCLNKMWIIVGFATIFGFQTQADDMSAMEDLRKHIRKKIADMNHRDQSSDFEVFVLGSFFDEKRKLDEQKRWESIPIASIDIQYANEICRLKSNDIPLEGLCSIELSDNFFFAGFFKKGILDGIAVGYYGLPYPVYFSFGVYKKGIPFNGSFFFFPEKKWLFSYRLLHYKKGTFHKITDINCGLAPFMNEMDEQGKILNGYDLVDFRSPSDILLCEIKNGEKIQQVNIKDFEKKGFSGKLSQEYFNALLISAKDNLEKSRMIDQKR